MAQYFILKNFYNFLFNYFETVTENKVQKFFGPETHKTWKKKKKTKLEIIFLISINSQNCWFNFLLTINKANFGVSYGYEYLAIIVVIWIRMKRIVYTICYTLTVENWYRYLRLRNKESFIIVIVREWRRSIFRLRVEWFSSYTISASRNALFIYDGFSSFLKSYRLPVHVEHYLQ